MIIFYIYLFFGTQKIKYEKNVFKPTSAEDDKAFFDSLTFDETPIFQEGGKVEKKEKNDKTYQEFLLTLPENL